MEGNIGKGDEEEEWEGIGGERLGGGEEYRRTEERREEYSNKYKI